MHPTIYLDTTVIIHLTDPPSANPITRACQQLTQLWWHTRCDPARTFVSREIPELDAANRAELDELHETLIRERAEMTRHLAESPYKEIIEKMKTAPLPPDSGRPVTISIKALRKLPPLARARVLYVLRDQLSD